MTLSPSLWLTLLTAAQDPASTAPRTEADRRVLEVADEIDQEVATLRGKTFLRPVAKEVYNKEQLAGFLERQLADPEQAEAIVVEQATLRAFGLIADDVDLAALYRAMLTSQVAGFYDPSDQTLRCISSPIEVLQRLTLVHEIYHSLQDQYFPLEDYMEVAGKATDVQRARQAVVEGDAEYFTMSIWMAKQGSMMFDNLLGENPAATLFFGIDQLIAQGSIPPYFIDRLSWPYLEGAKFIKALHADGGWDRVDRAFTEPPLSTEQILHPEKYLAGDDPPVAVTARVPERWRASSKEVVRDCMGEASIQEFVHYLANDVVHAKRASAGWGGDEVVVVERPGGSLLLVWRTAWDSERDAEHFMVAWRRVAMRQLDIEATDAPLLLAEGRGGAALTSSGRDAIPLPERLAGVVALPSEVSLLVATRGGAPATLVARRGREVHVVRGRELAPLDRAEVTGLVRELLHLE